jgi:hypothetical protein
MIAQSFSWYLHITFWGLLNNILAYRPVAMRWLWPQRPFLGNGSVNTFPLLGSRYLLTQQLNASIEELCFLFGPCRDVISKGQRKKLVEARSNTFTVTHLVVGGNEKGSLKPETVKYGHECQGTRIRERLGGRGPAAYIKGRPVLSSERAPHKNKTVTVKELQISGHEPQMGLDTRTYWLTDRQSQCDFDLLKI